MSAALNECLKLYMHIAFCIILRNIELSISHLMRNLTLDVMATIPHKNVFVSWVSKRCVCNQVDWSYTCFLIRLITNLEQTKTAACTLCSMTVHWNTTKCIYFIGLAQIKFSATGKSLHESRLTWVAIVEKKKKGLMPVAPNLCLKCVGIHMWPCLPKWVTWLLSAILRFSAYDAALISH